MPKQDIRPLNPESKEEESDSVKILSEDSKVKTFLPASVDQGGWAREAHLGILTLKPL